MEGFCQPAGVRVGLAADAPGHGTHGRWARGGGVPLGEAPVLPPSPAASVPGARACLPGCDASLGRFLVPPSPGLRRYLGCH